MTHLGPDETKLKNKMFKPGYKSLKSMLALYNFGK